VLLCSSPASETEDRWISKDSKSEELLVQSAYGFLRREIEGEIRGCTTSFGRSRHYLQPKSLLGG